MKIRTALPSFILAACALAASFLSLNGAGADAFQVKTVSTTQPKDDKVITMAADPWMPYTGVADPEGKKVENEGFLIELARLALEPEFTVKYLYMPWLRVINEVRSGALDAAVGADSVLYGDLIFPKKPLCYYRDALYLLRSREAEIKVSSIEDLKKYAIGGINAYPYVFIDVHPGLKTRMIDSKIPQLQLTKMLQSKEADLYLEDPSVFYYYLKQNKFNEADFVELQAGPSTPGFDKTDFQPIPMFIGFSPAKEERSEMLARKLTEGLAKIPADKLRALHEKYSIRNPATDFSTAPAQAPAAAPVVPPSAQ